MINICLEQKLGRFFFDDLFGGGKIKRSVIPELFPKQFVKPVTSIKPDQLANPSV